jgi:hypothetical protein
MALVTPDKNRVIIEDDGAKLRITMPVSAPPFGPVVAEGKAFDIMHEMRKRMTSLCT